MFDPNKNYSWDKELKIEITGLEYGVFQTLVKNVLNKPEIQTALHANQFLSDILKREVENGNFKEVE